MCSTGGGALSEIAEAIERLAAQAREEMPGQDLTTRVADIWLMVSALDPDLARRQRKYDETAE